MIWLPVIGLSENEWLAMIALQSDWPVIALTDWPWDSLNIEPKWHENFMKSTPSCIKLPCAETELRMCSCDFDLISLSKKS